VNARREKSSAEGAEERRERKNVRKKGELEAIDRKSPRFAKIAKDGAPSSSIGGGGKTRRA
jgi:hypothetical protein